MRRRRRLLLVVVAAAVLVLCWLAFVPYIVLDGGYELTVHVENRGPPIRAVRCETFGRREYAEETLEGGLTPESISWSAVVSPYQGQPVKVRTAVSYRDSYFGIELSRYQFPYLAVIVTYADGHRAGRVFDIPDGRVTREVRVVID